MRAACEAKHAGSGEEGKDAERGGRRGMLRLGAVSFLKLIRDPNVGICSVVARATREMGAALRQVGARGAVSVHPHVLILFAIAFT